MTATFPPPRDWLPSLAAHLDSTLGGCAVEGITGGHGWLSLRLDGRFLWLIATGSLRAAWLDSWPAPSAWLDLLGRHRTPFAAHLRGQIARSVAILRAADGPADGLCVTFADVTLSLRYWPRPGGLWLSTPSGEELAQSGRMGHELRAEPGSIGTDFDLDAHAQAARAQLADSLRTMARTRLRQTLSQHARKETKLLAALEDEQARARQDLSLRATADVLASQLHRLRGKESRVELEDFEGQPLNLELDPTLSPAKNLDRLYKRAAKAERTLAALAPRIASQHERIAKTSRAQESLDGLADDLDALLAFAQEHGMGPSRRAESTAARSAPAVRLPYRAYRLASGREVRVGRSARDNDVLTQRHANSKDLWLHAQGVEGSHVVLRSGGQPVPTTDIEAAAQLAAQFSKSKHSQTVPVLVTERRYVRKPKGAAPGSVVAERARTVFVSPGMPPGCEAVRSE